MSYPLIQSSAAQPLVFLMVDNTDHITPETGLSPTVTLSKSGGSFAPPSGAVTEIANGWYKVAGHATDTNTLGPLILHATGIGADPVDVVYYVGYDPFALQSTVDAIKAKTDNLPPDPVDASDVATLSGKIDTIDNFLDTEIADIKAKTDLIPASPAQTSDIPTAMQNADTLLARDIGSETNAGTLNERTVRSALRFNRNKVSLIEVPGSIVVKKEDDTTTAWTAPYTTDPTALPITGIDPV